MNEMGVQVILKPSDRASLGSAGKEPNDAFIKAIGTLAQVFYIITPDDQREQTLNDTMRSLKRI